MDQEDHGKVLDIQSFRKKRSLEEVTPKEKDSPSQAASSDTLGLRKQLLDLSSRIKETLSKRKGQ